MTRQTAWEKHRARRDAPGEEGTREDKRACQCTRAAEHYNVNFRRKPLNQALELGAAVVSAR